MAAPSIVIRNIKIGPWGGNGASSFDVGRSVTRVTRVKLYAGDVIDDLEISYVDGQNQVQTCRAGGRGGQLYQFELLPGEYINCVDGSYTIYDNQICIAQLKFKTTSGNAYGPYGQGGSDNFTVPVLEGRLVGFFGQYGRYVNSIGVYLAPV